VQDPRRATRQPARQLAPSPEPDQLSREADAAAVPDLSELSDATADLVGWVSAGGHDRSLPTERSRSVLAAALGVPETALARMTEADLGAAMERLRALVEQCTRLAGQVTVDELTGALRRGAGLAALQREMDRSRRLGGKGLVLVFIDVDGLKAINDRDGHAAGDERLRETVAALRERLRSYDLIVRYGGDEFLCVLTGSDLASAEKTAASLRAQVERRTGGTISVGLSELTGDDTVDALVERADSALYAGRKSRAR
jgi:diguanylate cyclase (GGDEF)-like protein